MVASSFGALFLAGGLGAAVAFTAGLAFATTAVRVTVLGGLGAVLACCFQLGVLSNGLADPLVQQLLTAAGTANALGWLAGKPAGGVLNPVHWTLLSERLEPTTRQ